MNIQMQFCGLTILLLLLYFYKRNEIVGLFTEKMFLRAMHINIICLILDIISVILIVNMDKLPLILVKIECKTYLVFLVLTGYMALAYASADIYRLVMENTYIKLCGLATVIDAIAIYILPIGIYHEGKVVYTYGPACIATYIGAVSMISLTLISVIRDGEKMNPRRRKAIKLWMYMWMVAAAVQFLYNNLLLVGFASALGMMILFFQLENPEANIDRKTGFFNSRAFAEYTKQCYKRDVNFCGIYMSFDESHANDTFYERLDEISYEVIQFMRSIPEVKIFRTDDKEYELIFSNTEAMDRAFGMLERRFKESWLNNSISKESVMVNPYIVVVPSSKIVKNDDEMIELIKYVRIQIANNPENHTIVADEGIVNEKRAREEMIDIINYALIDDRVEVFYQPIYSFHDKKFVSAEALVRIRKADGSIIPPGMFIPVAEETGLIAEIGERVFEKTCQFIVKNDIGQYGVEYIEVNLSVVQCESKSLADKYIGIMEKYNVPASFINLEITETASIAMKKTLLNNMGILIDYGVSFSLDDFGNGESNLNYIVDFPVQIVKFDKDMTQAYFRNEKAKYVLQAASDMIQGLGLKVVAEGVETFSQLRELDRLGIDYIQGYYFSKPLEAGKYLEFVKKKNVLERISLHE